SGCSHLDQPLRLVFEGGERGVPAQEPRSHEVSKCRREAPLLGGEREKQAYEEGSAHVDDQRSRRPGSAEPASEEGADREPRHRSEATSHEHEQVVHAWPPRPARCTDGTYTPSSRTE